MKIKSHPGVRSDLFKRPLDKTRITDFFGGVARVEVMTPPQGDQTAASPVVNDDRTNRVGNTGNEQPVAVFEGANAPSHDNVQASAPMDLLQQLPLWLSATQLKTLRIWSSLALVGLLVGWVSLKTT